MEGEFIMITKSKRSKMENLIYSVFDALDDSGSNTEKYKEMFSDMSDAQFDTFFKSFFADENSYLPLDIIDYERQLSLEKVEKAAKILEIPLFEKLVMPFVNMDKENPIVTKYEVPVGKICCSL
jgi:hypothetical protein